MSDNTEALPHTAVSTWSGFVYQGKIALYHCIQKMLESYEDSRRLKLQLESHDDFAIFDSNDCISLHQVKAYKSDLFSGYSADIIKQQESAKDKTVSKAYFHVAKKIKDLPKSEDFSKSYAPVEMYSYCDQENNEVFYCSLEQVNTYIENSLKELISKTESLAKWKKQTHALINIREILEVCINNKVISIHHKIHLSKTGNQKKIASEEFIPFKELYEIIENEDYDILRNEDFFLSRLKIDIGEYYKEFYDDNSYFTSEQMSKLENYIAQIVNFDNKTMLSFLVAVMPHTKSSSSTLSEYKDHSINRESMRYGLFKIFLSLITAKPSECGNILFTWQDNVGAFYYPTGIHTGNDSSDRICADIMKFSLEKDVEFLFEGNNLITLSIDRDSIGSIRKNDLKEVAIDIPSNTKITGFKNLKMISLAKVPSELKE